MTSPHLLQSDIVAETNELAPDLPFTAGGAAGDAEVIAPVNPEPQPEILSPEINAGDTSGRAEQDADEVFVTEPSHIAPVNVDATIATPHLEQILDAIPMPPNMLDFSQMGPVDSLLAYAQPFPPITQHAFDDLQVPLSTATDQQRFLEPSPYLGEHDETRVSAYAKLEFSDGEFYMNTYQLTMGRDQRAFREALHREEDERRRIDEEASTTRDPKTPTNLRREHSRAHRSVVSESGGILRDDDPPPGVEREERRRRRKASKKSKSTGSSSHHLSRRNSVAQPNGTFDYQAQPSLRNHAPASNGAAPVDPATLRPSPHDCPLVCIHPPATTSASGHKAISREHVRIAYSLKKLLFEAIILGRNGAFIDEAFCYQDDVIPLKSGSILQIGGVVVRFVLPDVAIGETGAEHRGEYEDNPLSERYSEGGKEMSFDFDESVHEGLVRETSSESSANGRQDYEDDQQGVGSGDEIEDEDEENDPDEIGYDSDLSQVEDDSDEQEEPSPIQVQESPKSEKKRGPGRPPKNGIMSKREQQLAKKEAAAQAAQAQAQSQNPGQNPSKAKKTVVKSEISDGAILASDAPVAPTKNKVGRPRKHPRPDTPPVQREKRKYTKRKPKEPKEGEVKEEGEGGEEVKEKKEKKPTKPPRSPSPTFNEADLTPEQLSKPQANYVTLIHEALSSSAAGMMSLPQIYRAIMRKYPFFVLKCSTTGWQSSVRHNLSQHHAFKKVERDGKGWMWAIVEGVSIEKEKKRRTTPPPQLPHGQMHHQPIYQAGHPPHMMPGQYPIPPPGYMLHPNIRPGQPYMGPPPPMNGLLYPHGPPPHMNPHHHPPPGFMPSIPQMAAITAPQQYSSPYAPKPAAPAAAPPPNPQLQHPPQPQPYLQQNDQRSPVDQKPPAPVAVGSVPATQNGANPQPALYQQPIQQPVQQPIQQPAQQPVQQPIQQPIQQQQFLQPLQQQPPHQASSQPPVPTLPSRPQHPPSVISAVETFRANLLSTLKDKTDNAEAVLASAVNRVLGYITQSAVPGDHFEPQIMEALKSVLSKVPEYRPVSAPSSTPSTSQQEDHKSPLIQANQEASQRSASQQPPKSTGVEKLAPSVMRPSFTGGVSRAQNTSVPRPPMITPGMLRANSGSPANAPPRSTGPSSASPVAAPSTVNGVSNVSNGASTPTPTPVVGSTSEDGQIAGQKRPLEDADEMPDFKRIATSGPAPLKT